jgi:hypothetical protein
MNIHIIVTGGTFDKEYNELNGELYFKNTHVPEMLSLGRSGLKTEIQTLMMWACCDMEDGKPVVNIRESAHSEWYMYQLPSSTAWRMPSGPSSSSRMSTGNPRGSR